MFLERKITGRMYGNEFAEFNAILGWKALKDSVDQFGEDEDGFTTLVPKLDGKDPDDAFSSVPYVPSFLIVADSRKKDSICYTKSNPASVVLRFSNHSCQPTSIISASSPLPPTNSKNSSIIGSSKIMDRK